MLCVSSSIGIGRRSQLGWLHGEVEDPRAPHADRRPPRCSVRRVDDKIRLPFHIGAVPCFQDVVGRRRQLLIRRRAGSGSRARRGSPRPRRLLSRRPCAAAASVRAVLLRCRHIGAAAALGSALSPSLCLLCSLCSPVVLSCRRARRACLLCTCAQTIRTDAALPEQWLPVLCCLVRRAANSPSQGQPGMAG